MDENLDDIREEFLRYAPSYAKDGARAAIDYLIDLKSQKLINDGLYYIVVMDLIGSTAFGAEFGNQALNGRIRKFFTSSISAISESKPKGRMIFMKEIGDAALLLADHFPDIVRWVASTQNLLNIMETENPIKIRTVVHIGEVSLEGVMPFSVALSQTFKAEKSIGDNILVLTEPAYITAYLTLAKAYHAFERIGEIALVGGPENIGLFKIIADSSEELQMLADEHHDDMD